MKFLGVTSVVLLAGAATLGCASAPRTPAQSLLQPSGDVSCHKVTTDRKTTVYCGTPDQWRELDRRVALIQQGVTCRWTRTPAERCLSADEWRRLDFVARSIATANGGFANARDGFPVYNPPVISYSVPQNNFAAMLPQPPPK